MLQRATLLLCLLLPACTQPTRFEASLQRVAAAAPTDTRIPVLLDTDANNELDDQHAIAYLLANSDVFRIVGMTTNETRNGGDVEKHTAEAVRVLRLMASDSKIPVVSGARGKFSKIRDTVGQPGFDGKKAVDFIRERAREATPERKLVLLPVGKMTNIALTLLAEPAMAERVRILWLGSHWPQPGEYNLEEDPESAAFVVDSAAPLDIAVVRWGQTSGTAAVKVSVDEVRSRLAGLGPRVQPPVPGRHGGVFSTFGDYSLSLFVNVQERERPLYDMAAVAVLKDPSWAKWTSVPAPKLEGERWIERPGNPRQIRFITDFDREAIVADMYASLRDPVLPQ